MEFDTFKRPCLKIQPGNSLKWKNRKDLEISSVSLLAAKNDAISRSECEFVECNAASVLWISFPAR